MLRFLVVNCAWLYSYQWYQEYQWKRGKIVARIARSFAVVEEFAGWKTMTMPETVHAVEFYASYLVHVHARVHLLLDHITHSQFHRPPGDIVVVSIDGDGDFSDSLVCYFYSYFYSYY
jgi:hypothetical protein